MSQIVDDQRSCSNDQIEFDAVGDSGVEVGVHFAEFEAVDEQRRPIIQDSQLVSRISGQDYSPEVG